MPGPPAFQFYAADWLAGTQLLSAAARGAYMTMLAMSWEQGAIPDNPTALYRAMGLAPSDPPFEMIWAELAPKWTLTKRGWENTRLEAIRASQNEFRKAAAKAGRASGRARRELAAERSFAIRSTDRPTEDERIANSPISDLRSPEDQDLTVARPTNPDLDHSIPLSAETKLNRRSGPAEPVWRRSEEAVLPHSNPAALIHGASMRQHCQHAFCCLDRSVCVPQFLHTEFKGKGRKTDAELQVWYRATMQTFAEHPIGDDTLVFWRNEFARWIGTVTAPPRDTAVSRMKAAAARLKAEGVPGTR